MDRKLSGIYFREKRKDKWENVCFEDLSKEKQERIVKEKSKEFVGNLAIMLAKDLKKIGNKFDIMVD